MAPAPWLVKLWMVNSECPLPPTPDVAPTGDLHVPTKDDMGFIANKSLAQNVSLAILSDYTEIRHLLQIICRFSRRLVIDNKHRWWIALQR
jgi:hypothetical protein